MTHASCLGHRADHLLIGSAINLAAGARHFAKQVTVAWLVALAPIGLGLAGELTLTVTDRSGHPVVDVVATAAPATSKVADPAAGHAAATMDQKNLAFVPQVLVVAVGTQVEFPNTDSVSHQVYSFSLAKRFQLPLYKGATHPPVIFDKAGLVVLGCNIHDQMVGYIYVTDAPLYGKTDSQGALHLTNVPTGDYVATLWSPFIADAPSTLTRTVHVGEHEPTSLRLQLIRDLRARPEPKPRRADWDY